MAFQLSPSVVVTETDLTNIIPAVSTSTTGLAGDFLWGPVGQIIPIDSEAQLVSVFGAPTKVAYKDFLCAASFLAYASNLQVVRTDVTDALNAVDFSDSASPVPKVNNVHTYTPMDFVGSGQLWIAKCPGAYGNNVGVAFTDHAGYVAVNSHGNSTWTWTDGNGGHHTWNTLFTDAPAAAAGSQVAEFHIVVFDATGKITGHIGQPLETYGFVTVDQSALYYDGTKAFFKTKVNNGSSWLWVGDSALLSGKVDGVVLSGGSDGTIVHGDGADQSRRMTAFDLFGDPESVDISMIVQAGGDTVVGAYILQDIAEKRLDCIALLSPMEADVVGLANTATVLENVLTTRTAYGSSSYGVMDSAYKLIYDRYNDVNRWIPLNGDIAGLCAQTDNTNAPWFSPAGLNRGNIKNAIALSYSEVLSTRDTLYQIGVNPCVVFPIQGAVLFGDKTMQSKPSAFDRINVRRLFITLEKAISTASKFLLFEQNDAVTQAQFVQMVEPFLRDVQARRGITDFRVVCNSTNNTPQVVDSNQFVADIYIKPTRSINFIRLNFVAVASGVNFSEIVHSV